MNNFLQNEKWKQRYMPVVLLLVCLVLYANTLSHSYAWDDYPVIVENEYVQRGVSAIPDIFMYKVFQEEREVYRPIPQTSFAIEKSLFDGHSGVSHFINLLLYAFSIVFLYNVILSLFPRQQWLFAGLVCLLFAVHPVHTEAVSNIKSRDELMVLLFGSLSLYYLLKWIAVGSWYWIWLAVLLLNAALMSKENAVTLMALLPACVFFAPNKDYLNQLIQNFSVSKKVVLFVVYLVGLVMLIMLQVQLFFGYTVVLFFVFNFLNINKNKYTLAAMVGVAAALLAIVGALVLFTNDAASAEAAYVRGVAPLNNILLGTSSIAEWFATIALVMVKYLQLLVSPVVLVHNYGFYQLPIVDFSSNWVIASLFIHVSLVLLALLFLKQKSAISLGLIWYFITISIYTHLFAALPDTLGERFLLLPSVGFCIFMVAVLYRFFNATFIAQLIKNRAKRMGIISALVLVVALLFGAKTIDRNRAWKNNKTLITTDIEKMSNNAKAHAFMADVIIKEMLEKNALDNEKQKNLFLYHQQKAIAIYPQFTTAKIDLGTAYMLFKDVEAAKKVYEDLIKEEPDKPFGYFELGKWNFTTENYKEAIALLKKALSLEPRFIEAYRYLSWSYYESKQFTLAVNTLIQGNEIFTEQSQFPSLLGYFYLLEKKYERAIDWSEKALQINPNDLSALENLLLIYQQTNNRAKYKETAAAIQAIKAE